MIFQTFTELDFYLSLFLLLSFGPRLSVHLLAGTQLQLQTCLNFRKLKRNSLMIYVTVNVKTLQSPPCQRGNPCDKHHNSQTCDEPQKGLDTKTY